MNQQSGNRLCYPNLSLNFYCDEKMQILIYWFRFFGPLQEQLGFSVILRPFVSCRQSTLSIKQETRSEKSIYIIYSGAVSSKDVDVHQQCVPKGSCRHQRPNLSDLHIVALASSLYQFQRRRSNIWSLIYSHLFSPKVSNGLQMTKVNRLSKWFLKSTKIVPK